MSQSFPGNGHRYRFQRFPFLLRERKRCTEAIARPDGKSFPATNPTPTREAKMDSAVLRELGAETRTFRTVKGAMLWYAGQLAARLRVNGGFEHGSTPRSTESINRTNATFAALAGCLRGYHPADVESPLPGEHVLWLVAWYETTWGDGQFLADKAELSRWAFTRRCRKTERTLRRRMEMVGLLEEAE